ncbi:tRNA (guanine(46)-N(7))-methyltransferase TrmB [Deinococcus gobiensis]|uniref:tRNA (guanine-N(7)-)-methyltransferase n=1 Tax=Deinococcus gobiensis (strain DSM 21396 / JCM 16679 / CGMCC 1.7299 / I-0) TaxID=745776 RepID=H8GZH8_DEIGI|nr:tRNA (guanine-N(7)-)-methyltransferase [Deinococcus gobiensis]AFD26216.1 tRNA methyltransferase [Deinococcus gobiensis I-0]
MIYQLGDFRFPDDPARLYPQTPERPWVLEVGFGDGHFWPHYARTFAQAPNYLGVELSGVSLLKAHRRLKDAGLENAILTKLPADVLVREVVPPRSLHEIVVNFPDPWPKAGHTDHRLLRAPFFRLAASRLRAGGAVLLTTDHDEYFEFACAEAEASGVMRVDQAQPPAAALETKYARKWRDLGLSAHHARFVPTAHPEVPGRAFTPYPENETDVPHAILTLPAAFAPTDFAKRTARAPARGPEWTVVLLDLFASLRRDGWVVQAHVVEEGLTQEVLIGVTGREDGTHLVRLARFGGPIITPGVKAAVGVVTGWLEEEGAQVTHRGY